MTKLPKHQMRGSTIGELSCVLTINGGSSSIRFAVYEACAIPRRRLIGKIDRIGLIGANLTVTDPSGKPLKARHIAPADHRTAVALLLDWLEAHAQRGKRSVMPDYDLERSEDF